MPVGSRRDCLGRCGPARVCRADHAVELGQLPGTGGRCMPDLSKAVARRSFDITWCPPCHRDVLVLNRNTRSYARSCHFSASIIQRHPMSSLLFFCLNNALALSRCCSRPVDTCCESFLAMSTISADRVSTALPCLPTCSWATRSPLNFLEHVPFKPVSVISHQAYAGRELCHISVCFRRR